MVTVPMRPSRRRRWCRWPRHCLLSGVTVGSAALNGMVNPNGATTTAYFQWGTNTSYGSSTALTSAGNGNGNVTVNTALGNLFARHGLYYLIIASNNVGAVSGVDCDIHDARISPAGDHAARKWRCRQQRDSQCVRQPRGIARQLSTSSGVQRVVMETRLGQPAPAMALMRCRSIPRWGICSRARPTIIRWWHPTALASRVGADATFTIPALTPDCNDAASHRHLGE